MNYSSKSGANCNDIQEPTLHGMTRRTASKVVRSAKDPPDPLVDENGLEAYLV